MVIIETDEDAIAINSSYIVNGLLRMVHACNLTSTCFPKCSAVLVKPALAVGCPRVGGDIWQSKISRGKHPMRPGRVTEGVSEQDVLEAKSFANFAYFTYLRVCSIVPRKTFRRRRCWCFLCLESP